MIEHEFEQLIRTAINVSDASVEERCMPSATFEERRQYRCKAFVNALAAMLVDLPDLQKEVFAFLDRGLVREPLIDLGLH